MHYFGDKKLAVVIFFNLAFSVIYFKQLVYPGDEFVRLNLSSILITPFAIFFSFLGIVIILGIAEKKRFSFWKASTGEKFVWLFLIVFLVGFISVPFGFLADKNGYKVAIPLLLAILEPLKAKFLFNQTLKQVAIRLVIIFTISFPLAFVSAMLPSLIKNNDYTWPAYFGGFYFLALAYLDYKYDSHSLKASDNSKL